MGSDRSTTDPIRVTAMCQERYWWVFEHAQYVKDRESVDKTRLWVIALDPSCDSLALADLVGYRLNG